MNRRKRKIPELNTTALPDLIFTVLFFFMIVTHLWDDRTDMQIKIPYGEQLQKIERRYAVSNMYIGRNAENAIQIQINNKIVSSDEVTKYILAEKNKISDEEQDDYTVCIKADQDTPLHVISQIKESLQSLQSEQVIPIISVLMQILNLLSP